VETLFKRNVFSQPISQMLSLRARDTQLQDAAKVNTLHDRHVTDPLESPSAFF